MGLGCAIKRYLASFVAFETYSHRAIFTISFVGGVFDGASKVCVVEYHDGESFLISLWCIHFCCKEGCVAHGVGGVPIVGCDF